MENETFRDHLNTIGKDGKRLWIYARQPKGKLYNYRMLVAILLLVFFFVTPFIKVNGEPLLLANFIERKFVLFGIIFWPQDAYLLFLMMISFMVFIILFTAVLGRIWCGWTCPQTVLMEMVFRRIEYWLEGNAAQQKDLDRQPITFRKFRIKALKHLIFYGIAFVIANFLLSYIIGIEAVIKIAREPITMHIVGFGAILLFSFLVYFIFAKFREQVCMIVCPYGRLQGALTDPNTILISYDYQRGEPRSRMLSSENRNETGKGDCVDCHSCITVCPTGIDIRNGTQLECINCTACTDECNATMRRVGLPEGLIRYASENGIAHGEKLRFTPRLIAYTFLLTALFTFFLTLFFSRADIETTILRTPGMMYQEMEVGKITNLYNIKVVNKTHKDIPLTVKLLSPAGEIRMAGGNLSVKNHSSAEGVFFVVIDKNTIPSANIQVRFGIFLGDKMVEERKMTFVAPVK